MDNSVPFVSETFRSKEVDALGGFQRSGENGKLCQLFFILSLQGISWMSTFTFWLSNRVFFVDSVSVSIPSKVGICFETNLSVRGKTCLSNAQSVNTHLFMQNSWKNTGQHMKGPTNMTNSYPHLPEQSTMITNCKNLTCVSLLRHMLQI